MVTGDNHQLLIMRHAKSDWNADFDRDFDRPLVQRGSKEAHKIANWLKKQGLSPDLFLSSPALRARETALIVADGLGIDVDNIVWEKDIYDASVDDLLQVVKAHADDRYCILLIGHNPGVDNLLCYLSKDGPERTLSGKLMTTSALAILEFKGSPINTDKKSAILKNLLRPKDLK